MDENHTLLDPILQEYTELGEITVLEEGFVQISYIILFFFFSIFFLSTQRSKIFLLMWENGGTAIYKLIIQIE